MRKMNSAAMTGFLFCIAVILFGIATNGGISTIVNFLHLPSLLVTLGGAFFALMITSDSWSDYVSGLKGFAQAFQKTGNQAGQLMQHILDLSMVARKEGLLALEEQNASVENELLKKGIRLIIDGADPELVRDILGNDLTRAEEKNAGRVRFWQDLGSYSPAWGMVGTLLGLINMMLSMGEDAGAIGAGMSLALITTLYGSVMANWVCIPIARRLEKKNVLENRQMELVIEGVLSIQAGENTSMIEEKLRTFV